MNENHESQTNDDQGEQKTAGEREAGEESYAGVEELTMTATWTTSPTKSWATTAARANLNLPTWGELEVEAVERANQKPGGNQMQMEAFTPDDLSGEALLALFDAAMYDAKLDDDGDVVVGDQHTIFVSVNKKKTYVRFLCLFHFREGTNEQAAHALCNRVNDGLIIIRGCLHNDTGLVVDWYVPAVGGIGKKTVVLAFRRFSDLLGEIGRFDTEDIIE